MLEQQLEETRKELEAARAEVSTNLEENLAIRKAMIESLRKHVEAAQNESRQLRMKVRALQEARENNKGLVELELEEMKSTYDKSVERLQRELVQQRAKYANIVRDQLAYLGVADGIADIAANAILAQDVKP